jgi:hypothetical protein
MKPATAIIQLAFLIQICKTHPKNIFSEEEKLRKVLT